MFVFLLQGHFQTSHRLQYQFEQLIQLKKSHNEKQKRYKWIRLHHILIQSRLEDDDRSWLVATKGDDAPPHDFNVQVNEYFTRV